MTIVLQFILYCLLAFGVAYAVGQSTISLPFRKAIEPDGRHSQLYVMRTFFLLLIECPACLGFWLGMMFEACITVQLFELIEAPGLWHTLLYGTVTMSTNHFLGRLSEQRE